MARRRWTIAVALVSTVAGTMGVTSPHRAWAARTPTDQGPPGGAAITVTELTGPDGQPVTEVTDINDRGQIVGVADRPGGSSLEEAGVLWVGGGEASYIQPSSGPRPDITRPAGINERGQVVGSFVEHVENPGDPGSPSAPFRAFTWRPGRWRAPGPPGNLQDEAFAVNGRGQVLGVRHVSVPDDPDDPSGWEIVAWQGGRVVTAPFTFGLSDFPWSTGDINDRGQAMVQYTSHSRQTTAHTALWEVGGDVTVIPTAAGLDVKGTDINERGQIVGSHQTADGTTLAFLWDDGEMTVLAPLEGNMVSAAEAINDRGQVVGSSSWGTPDEHAVLWEDGRTIDLGTLGGPRSVALDINDRGQVVGWSDTATGESHAFLWEDGEMTDLGALVEGDSHAHRINDRGQVIGKVKGEGSSDQAVLWTLPRRTR